jgi:hypothetical protein
MRGLIKFGNKIYWYWLKIHKELLFEFIEKIYWKNYFKLSFIPWWNSFEKIEFQILILYLLKPMQAILQRKYFTKWFIINKVCISNTMFENKSQILVYFLWLQRTIWKTLFQFFIMQTNPFPSIRKFFLKIYFYYENWPLIVFRCCFEF